MVRKLSTEWRHGRHDSMPIINEGLVKLVKPVCWGERWVEGGWGGGVGGGEGGGG